MKKNTIWIVGVVMGICCFALLYLQVSYIDAMVGMRKGHFEEGVRRSLYQVSYDLEMAEMREYLSKDVRRDILRGQFNDNGIRFEHSYVTSSESGDVVSKFEFKTFVLNPPHFSNSSLESGKNLSLEEVQRLSLDVFYLRLW